MKISIIIPCYNEAQTIEILVNKILNIKDLNYEIIIIDDASNDGTKKIIENKLRDKVDKIIFNKKNYGKGFSIREGIKISEGEIILIQDADLEYSPSDYKKLLNPIINKDADVVYGSRFISSSEKRVLYFWHSLGNKLITLMSNFLTNLNLTDIEVCYKVFKSEVIKSIHLKENRFGFEPEVTAKISKLNLKIFEVGISYNGRKYSEGKKITWKDGFSALRCIIKYNLFK